MRSSIHLILEMFLSVLYGDDPRKPKGLILYQHVPQYACAFCFTVAWDLEIQ